MTPIRRIESDWLTARRGADSAARDGAVDLVHRLAEHLGLAAELTLVDLGAGTGANPAWLAPQLDRVFHELHARAPRQHWLLLDHDPDLLAARDVGEQPQVATSRAVLAPVDGLADVLGQTGRPVVVTCSALLDLLTAPQIEKVARSVTEAADAVLLALSVTGEVSLSPGHADDELVLDTFNAHQQRMPDAGVSDSPSGPAPRAVAGDSRFDARSELHLAGPQGWRIAAHAFAARGWEVTARPTPWVLDHAEPRLLRRLLADRVAAVLEQLEPRDPRGPVVHAWWTIRSEQIAAAALRAEVGHVDVLALPRP